MLVKARKQTVTNPGKVQEVLSTVLSAEHEVDRMKEHFWILGLNTRNVIQYIDLVSLGLEASLFIEEVFQICTMPNIVNHSAHSTPREPNPLRRI